MEKRPENNNLSELRKKAEAILRVSDTDLKAMPHWELQALVHELQVYVTESKLAEEAMRESETQFRTLADAIPQLCWMAHSDGWVFWYNKRWYEYTGTAPEQMKGWGWKSVHDPEILPKVLELWRASIATGNPFDMVLPLRGADGVFRPFLTRVMPVRGRDGKVVRWFGTGTDITEQKRAEEALRQAEREKADFYAMVTHDIKSPLTTIQSYADLILMGEAARENKELREMAAGIQASGKRILGIVDDFLAFSRMDSGKLSLKESLVDFPRLLTEAHYDFAHIMKEKGLKFDLHMGEDIPRMLLDRRLLERAVHNLLRNSASYTPVGGRITLSAEKVMDSQGESVVISVSDTGHGISEAEQERVFDKYYRSPRTAGVKGSGLGLAMVKLAAEVHGGRVELESTEGKGSTFRMHLPVI